MVVGMVACVLLSWKWCRGLRWLSVVMAESYNTLFFFILIAYLSSFFIPFLLFSFFININPECVTMFITPYCLAALCMHGVWISRRVCCVGLVENRMEMGL